MVNSIYYLAKMALRFLTEWVEFEKKDGKRSCWVLDWGICGSYCVYRCFTVNWL